MEVTLKDESGVSPSSILEKTIALTKEVQVNTQPPSLDVLSKAVTELEAVPENKVLRVEGEPIPVGEKIVNAVSSAVGAVVDGVKGFVESVKTKTDDVKDVVLEPEVKVTHQSLPLPVFEKCVVSEKNSKSLPEHLFDNNESLLSLSATPLHELNSSESASSLPTTPLHVFIPKSGVDGIKVEQLSPTVSLVQDKFIVEMVQEEKKDDKNTDKIECDVKSDMTAALDKLASPVTEAGEKAVEAIEKASTPIVQAVEKAVSTPVSEAVDKVTTPVAEVANNAATSVAEAVDKVVTPLVEAVQNTVSSVPEAVEKESSSVVESVQKAATPVIEAAQQLMDAVEKNISPVLESTPEVTVTPATDPAKNEELPPPLPASPPPPAEVLAAAVDSVAEVANKLEDTIKQEAEAAEQKLSEVGDAAESSTEQILGQSQSAVEDATTDKEEEQGAGESLADVPKDLVEEVAAMTVDSSDSAPADGD